MSVARVYSPYGQHENKSAHVMPGFNGQRYDPLSHTYALALGYRSYSPPLMRFQAPDDLSPFGQGGLNAYTYCAGDPVNYADDSGHAPTAAQLQQRIKQMGLKTPSPVSKKNRSTTGSEGRGLQLPLASNGIAKPQKRVTFNDTTKTHYYPEERTQSKRELYLQRKSLITYIEKEYSRAEVYQRELNVLLSPSTEQMFKHYTSSRSHLSLLLHNRAQLEDAHLRLTQLLRTLKSIRL